MNWHSKKIQEVLEILQTDIHYGLTESQVEEIQKQYGKNCIKENKKKSLFLKFLMQFNDLMIFILLVAAILSFIISYIEGNKDFLDPLIILVIVILNAILGLIQESKAEKSLEALKKLSSPKSKVIRNGFVKYINTDEIVPGDIILLETGDNIAADARLISSNNLKVEESALTGESLPVEKDSNEKVLEDAPLGDRVNMVFSGSSINYGRGKAVVIATGMDTEVGRIASMIIKDDSPDTPLQKRLQDIGKTLGITALVICTVIFGLGVIRKFSPFTMFMTSVSLAVAAIPEGLPAIVTIMLAIGVQKMAKRNAIIRKLPAVETLGSATVICSDKTGTLTQNKMEVVEIYDQKGILSNRNEQTKNILRYACLCNDSIVEDRNNEIFIQGDPTETSMVTAALNININKKFLDKEYPRIAEIPFESKRKLMTTVHKNVDGSYFSVTKGAPDILLEKCSYYYDDGKIVKLTKMKLREIINYNSKMADKALRVLGIGFRIYNDRPYYIDNVTIEKDIIFLGLMGIMDPPREEAKEAVKVCKKAGIKPVMITGDHIITAKAIAHKLGIMNIGDRAMTGEELSRISEEDLCKIIDDYSVFARVSPEHKVRIVKAFQKNGNVVAMTGDGVNDAPALKSADIGCAMGISGTDVAKNAADMILVDDNFATIVEAIKEGRSIYSNIRKSIHFLLSSNIGEIITIFVAILLGWPTPLLAAHLLWVNFVTDSFPAIALGLDPTSDDIMECRSYNKNKSFFADGLWQQIIFQGCMIGLLALIAFGIGTVYFDESGNNIIGRTMAFATLSISQLIHAFNVRTEKTIFSFDIFDNIYLLYSLFIGIFLQVSVIAIPFFNGAFKVQYLNLLQWFIVAILCMAPIFIVEFEKLLSIRIKDKKYYKILENK